MMQPCAGAGADGLVYRSGDRGMGAEPCTPGGQSFYSALTITTALTLRAAFGLALRLHIADDAPPARDIGLHASALAVAGGFLPSHAAVLGDGLDVSVALCRRGLGRLAQHRVGARRDNARASGWRSTAEQADRSWRRRAAELFRPAIDNPWRARVRRRPHRCRPAHSIISARPGQSD